MEYVKKKITMKTNTFFYGLKSFTFFLGLSHGLNYNSLLGGKHLIIGIDPKVKSYLYDNSSALGISVLEFNNDEKIITYLNDFTTNRTNDLEILKKMNIKDTEQNQLYQRRITQEKFIFYVIREYLEGLDQDIYEKIKIVVEDNVTKWKSHTFLHQTSVVDVVLFFQLLYGKKIELSFLTAGNNTNKFNRNINFIKYLLWGREKNCTLNLEYNHNNQNIKKIKKYFHSFFCEDKFNNDALDAFNIALSKIYYDEIENLGEPYKEIDYDFSSHGAIEKFLENKEFSKNIEFLIEKCSVEKKNKKLWTMLHGELEKKFLEEKNKEQEGAINISYEGLEEKFLKETPEKSEDELLDISREELEKICPEREKKESTEELLKNIDEEFNNSFKIEEIDEISKNITNIEKFKTFIDEIFIQNQSKTKNTIDEIIKILKELKKELKPFGEKKIDISHNQYTKPELYKIDENDDDDDVMKFKKKIFHSTKIDISEMVKNIKTIMREKNFPYSTSCSGKELLNLIYIKLLINQKNKIINKYRESMERYRNILDPKNFQSQETMPHLNIEGISKQENN